mgnify:CR=1 FL=1
MMFEGFIYGLNILIALKIYVPDEQEFVKIFKIKNRYKKLLDISPEGIIVVNNNQIEYMNDQFIIQMYDYIINCGIYDEKKTPIEPKVSTMKRISMFCRKNKRKELY